MKIFINSHNRSEVISTPMLLDDCAIPYTIILHNEEQKELYLKNPKIKPETLFVANQPVNMTGIRNWILENLVDTGEWYVILDDNITEFQCVSDEFYSKEDLPVKTETSKYKEVFENKVDAKRMVQVFQESIIEAEKIGANLIGFASTPNFFFRNKKYRQVGYVIGKTQIIKKTDLRYELQVSAMDDYLWTALNLERFGKVLINNYFVAIKKHYAKGGIGTYQERLPAKLKDCDYLMKRFNGLFRYKIKAGTDPKAELAIRFTSTEQVERWRAYMRTR